MLVATALVLMMTPALGLFYSGLVRAKNTLNTFMMSIAALGVVTVTWAVVGYSLAFDRGNGVIGGAAYMTVEVFAARIALELLPRTWSLGPVLMNMNCPTYLRTDEIGWREEVLEIASNYGRRIPRHARATVAHECLIPGTTRGTGSPN